MGIEITPHLDLLTVVKGRTHKANLVLSKSLHLWKKMKLKNIRYLVGVYIYPSLLYGLQAFNLNQEAFNVIRRFARTTEAKILNVQPWTGKSWKAPASPQAPQEDRIRDLEKAETDILVRWTKRKLTFIGHFYRHEQEARTELKAHLEGLQRTINIPDLLNLDLELANDRPKWKKVIKSIVTNLLRYRAL